MSQQTAFRLKIDVVRILAELQAKTGKNKTLLLHEALRYYYRAYKAGLIASNTNNSECYTVKTTQTCTKAIAEQPKVAQIAESEQA